MKYSELNVGDCFKIAREHDGNVYKKLEYSFIDVLTMQEYRKLWGGTKVIKVVGLWELGYMIGKCQ